MKQYATLQLREARHVALDAYEDHDRVAAGTIDDHFETIADAWIDHHRAGRRVAVTAETNRQVDDLNAAIQARRRDAGDLDDRHAVPVAGSETASPGDIVMTRRNDRTLTTDTGEPIRNRELWRVDTVTADGSLTVSRIQGQGTVTLPADYAREHVRIGYAATAHGHQGDTVDVSYTLVDTSTTHRGLYVGATRGRAENHLLVVTDEPELAEARDVLEYALTNDRADVPAIVQRRRLAEHVQDVYPSPDRRLADANRAVIDARRRAAPYLEAVDAAREGLHAAKTTLGDLERRRDASLPIVRSRFRGSINEAHAAVEAAEIELGEREAAAQPLRSEVECAVAALDRLDTELAAGRMRQRFDELQRRPVARDALGL